MPLKYSLVILILFIHYFNFLSPVNASEEEKDISNKQIANILVSMSVDESKLFSQNVQKGRALIASHLTYRDPNETYQGTISEITELINLFNNELNSSSIQDIANLTIHKVSSMPFHFKQYLEFCLAINPVKRRFFSSMRVPDDSLRNVLKYLGCPHSINITKDLKIILKNIGKSFNSPMYVSPFDIYQFRTYYKKLEEYFGGTKEVEVILEDESIPHYAVAENFLSMNDQDIRDFCANVYLAQQQTVDTILHCQVQKPKDRWWGSNKNVDEMRIILNMLDDHQDDLRNIRDHPIWIYKKNVITLHRYLTFCCDLFPKNKRQESFPFISRERWLGHEFILNQLGLNSDFQRDEKVRSVIYQLQDTIGIPLQMSPLKVYQFKKHYQDLQVMTRGNREQTAFEDFIDLSIKYRMQVGITMFVCTTSLISWQLYS